MAVEVRILLDTHIALWALMDDHQLGSDARELIANPANDVFISAASVWEIAIKHALGRSGIPFNGSAALEYFEQAGYRSLAVSPEHAAAVDKLPKLHRDPFDRLLVAQATAEPMHLVTHDRVVARYSESILLV